MAYVALTSLMTTIELQFRQQIPRVSLHLHDDQAPIKSFYENLSSLQAFLEKKSSAGDAAIKYFGTLIRDFALKVEDDIEIQLSNFVVAKAKDDAGHQEAASQQLCQILQQAQQKIADVVEIINSTKEYILNDDLTYLNTIIDHHIKSIQSNAMRVVYDRIQTLFKSLIESLSTSRGFLYTSKDLETKIRYLAVDGIKIQLSSFLLVKDTVHEEEAFQELCQTLHQVTENAAQLLSTIHNTSSNEADDDDEANDTQSVCYPKLEEGRIMVGHQNDVSIIKSRLFSSFKGVKVIPITGMPGIGKTTLARKILEDQSVAFNFQVRGWVTVTQNYNHTKVLRDLLQSISPSHEIIKEAPLWEQVRECLEEKRYLIVLDDIWSTGDWNSLEALLPNCENGSCILLTTRFYGVADYACTIKGTYHVMSLLDPNESWDLFCTIFPLQRYRAPSFGKFRSHLFHVVEICEGLPLSIVVVAKRLSECKDNIQHELKKIEKEIELLGILDYSALILMYNQLPEYLKGCFLYLGVFPKRSEIQVKILLRLWIAEGFVKPSKNKELERIAYCYLKDLIDRSLVLINKQTFDGKIKTCRVHSVMHNICFREAQKEGILCAVNTQQLPMWSLNAFANSCRWLSLCKHRFDYYVLFSSNNPRSIFFFQENTEIFVSLKLLRVLAFVQSSFLQRLLMQLGDLIFLRYLSVTQWFEGLSDVVSSNVNLQTLIVSCNDSESQVGAPILHLPSTIWESPQLRHLELGTCYVVNPPSMVKENLQTLSWVDPTHCRSRVYSNFPNIKILKVVYKVDLEASQISGCSSNCFILDKLGYLEQLKSLTVSVSVGCILTFPERFIFPSQLKKLKLSGTNLSGWDLTVIGRLQWLEVLKLENAFHKEVWEVAEGGFYRLRLLVLKDKKLKRLEAYTDSFPCLEHLVLRCCECLEEIPSSFGEIFCFKSIEMDRFSHRPSIVASARIIQEKLKKNFGKENFEIKIQGQGQVPEYIEECVEDVEKENCEIKMEEEGESLAGAGAGGQMVEEEIGVGKLKSYIHKLKKTRFRNLLKRRNPKTGSSNQIQI
ncbi:PREDICTED: putative late blight resistance protein homolog R1A-10 [Ipomoea nil]|uniref:putative late blight resistance protein homolog R1A-10 n=1 Tax=Ipomoea nil TaxID=35883 RepID=UPI0009019BD3|nr:PREDICTED: putative late blight resistance protein homolog R1A-10 [Ipomoea nil]